MKKTIALILTGLIVLSSALIFGGCGNSYESEKFGTIKWPDSKLAKMLPTPESTTGMIDSDTDDSLTVYIGNTTADQFEKYVSSCKENGFTKKHDQGTDSDGCLYYNAENKDGYELELEYHKADDLSEDDGYKETMIIELNTPLDNSDDEDADDSDDSSSKKSKKSTKSKTKSTSKSKSKSSSDKVSASFKETMDSYEAFFDEYIEFMKKYNDDPSNLELLNEYSDYMTKYADYMEKLEKIDEDELSTADAAYYVKVQARITKKLAEVAS